MGKLSSGISDAKATEVLLSYVFQILFIINNSNKFLEYLLEVKLQLFSLSVFKVFFPILDILQYI